MMTLHSYSCSQESPPRGIPARQTVMTRILIQDAIVNADFNRIAGLQTTKATEI
jgi:hypothetical protein